MRNGIAHYRPAPAPPALTVVPQNVGQFSRAGFSLGLLLIKPVTCFNGFADGDGRPLAVVAETIKAVLELLPLQVWLGCCF